MKIVSFIVTSLAIPMVGLLCMTGNPFLSVLPIVFAMPIQWNAFKTAGGNSSSTIFSSNNVRQAVILLTGYVMDRDAKSLRNARFYWATLLFFHIGVASSMLYVMKYESAALLMLIVVYAIMKKNESIRRGRLRTSSIHRSLTLTFSVCLASMTMRSLLSKKHQTRRARPVRAKILMVMNHAVADSGVL